MVITVITETYWPEVNGVAMTLQRLVNGLCQLGHEVQLICPGHKDRKITDLPANICYHSVKGIPIPGYGEANFGLPAARLLKKLWARTRPDVIYVATEGPLGWSATKEANKTGIPVVSGFHTNFHTYSKHYNMGFMAKLVENYLVKFHNKTQTTVVPTPDQQLLLEKMGINSTAVMGRGVDTSLYSPTKRDADLRKHWGVQDHEPVLIYVGRIAEEKNLDLTIRTYYAMRELNPLLKFVLVGDGPMLERLKQEHPHFIYTGNLEGETLAKHYASADIFTFSSLTETFGNVILEAMASGLGVVAYNYAAARLHIQTGENGMVARLNDAEDFIHKSRMLLQNNLLLKKVRMNASRDALQHSWDSIVEQFETILSDHLVDGDSNWNSLRSTG